MPQPRALVDAEAEPAPRSKGLRASVTLGGSDAPSVLAEAEAASADELPIEPEQLTPIEREVYEELRAARNAKAKAMERSMFIVCGNRTMVEMCRLVPTTKAELLELHGMGELKCQRYGDLLLDALRPHAAKLHAEHAAMAQEADFFMLRPLSWLLDARLINTKALNKGDAFEREREDVARWIFSHQRDHPAILRR